MSINNTKKIQVNLKKKLNNLQKKKRKEKEIKAMTNTKPAVCNVKD